MKNRYPEFGGYDIDKGFKDWSAERGHRVEQTFKFTVNVDRAVIPDEVIADWQGELADAVRDRTERIYEDIIAGRTRPAGKRFSIDPDGTIVLDRSEYRRC